MTDYHDLNTPAEGATDWHLPLNENFRQIDRRVEIRDVEAALSDYPPKEDAKFLATDTGTIYIGSGSEWTKLSFGSDGVTYTAGDDTVSHELLDTYTAPSSGENQRQELQYSFSGLSEYDEYQMVIRTYNEDDDRDRELNICGETIATTSNLRSRSVLRTVGHAAKEGVTPARGYVRSDVLNTIIDISDGEVTVQTVQEIPDSETAALLQPHMVQEVGIDDALTFGVSDYSAFAPDLNVQIEVYGTTLDVS